MSEKDKKYPENTHVGEKTVGPTTKPGTLAPDSMGTRSRFGLGARTRRNPGNSPGILDWLVDFFINPIANAITTIIDNQATVIKTLSPITAIHDALRALAPAITSISEDLSPEKVKTPDDAKTVAEKIQSTADANLENLSTAAITIEAGTMGLVDISIDRATKLPGPAFLETVSTTVRETQLETGFLPYLTRHWQKQYRPTLPGVQDLPSMLWRELIKEEKAKDVLAEHGFSDEFVAAYMELTKKIPGYQDLITLMVREIITPEDFITWIGRQGYSSYWAGALYDAHFRLPSPEHIYEAFHRGLISEEELEKYIFWHDYQPTPRKDISKSDQEIMRGLTKTLIPRVDLRRAWRQGELTDTQLEDRYRWLGYEDDAALMARIQKAIALSPERTAVARQFLAGLRKGVKSEAEIRKRLTDLSFPKSAVDLLIEAENVRREIGAVEPDEEPRILSTSQITAAYKKRLFTREVALEMLLAIGWDPDAADTLLMLSEPAPEKVDQLTAVKTAAATLYREGYMSVEEFEGHLRAANYSDEDITRIRLAEDLRYRWDYLKDLQAADIEAYRKDILTLDELTASLLTRGLQPERAAALLAKEAYKKLPKPKAA